MNFSINSYYKSTPNFTALKFTKEKADYSKLSENDISVLKSIAKGQKNFKNVDIEIGKFSNKKNGRPYIPKNSNDFDVVVNTHSSKAYTQIYGAEIVNLNKIKVYCDSFDKDSMKPHYYDSIVCYGQDIKSAQYQVEEINSLAKQNSIDSKLKSAATLARLLEYGNPSLQELMDSCEKV